jgi:hypothetical protein
MLTPFASVPSLSCQVFAVDAQFAFFVLLVWRRFRSPRPSSVLDQTFADIPNGSADRA